MSDSKAPKGIATDIEWIRALADVLSDTGLTEIEIEKNDIKLRVARGGVTTQIAAPLTPAPAMAAPETPAPSTAASAGDHPGAVKSPMVGTAYIGSAPGAAPFIKVGDKVREGQTLMIVEAMKTMNEIKAPRGGSVIEILVQDAQPVEFEEPLVILG